MIFPARVWEFSGNFNEKGEALWCSRPATKADRERRSEVLLDIISTERLPVEPAMELEDE